MRSHREVPSVPKPLLVLLAVALFGALPGCDYGGGWGWDCCSTPTVPAGPSHEVRIEPTGEPTEIEVGEELVLQAVLWSLREDRAEGGAAWSWSLGQSSATYPAIEAVGENGGTIRVVGRYAGSGQVRATATFGGGVYEAYRTVVVTAPVPDEPTS